MVVAPPLLHLSVWCHGNILRKINSISFYSTRANVKRAEQDITFWQSHSYQFNSNLPSINHYLVFLLSAPSQAPPSFSVIPLTSSSVRASWQLPPANSTYGIIIGFKLLYRNKSSSAAPLTVITIGRNSTLTRNVTGLAEFTEYEFQVLAFSSMGNGPKSSVQKVRTNEDGKTYKT